MTELRNEKGLMEGEKSLYGVFESKIKKNSCCPVCMRGFENKNAAEEVVTDVSFIH